MTDRAWADGYAQLVVAFPASDGQRDAAARGRLYRHHLDELADDQWLLAVTRAVRECRWFPRVSELRAFAAPDPGSQLARAAEVFEAILGEYECGRTLSHRDVVDRWGVVARDAFMAAGGVAAFQWCGDADSRRWRLKAFQDGWRECQQSVGSLPSGAERLLVASGLTRGGA